MCTYVVLFCVRGMKNVRFSGYIYIFMRRIPIRERTNEKNKEKKMKKRCVSHLQTVRELEKMRIYVVRVYFCTRVGLCTCMYAHMCFCVYVRVCGWVCVCVFMCVSVCVCLCVCACEEKKRARESERERERLNVRQNLQMCV